MSLQPVAQQEFIEKTLHAISQINDNIRDLEQRIRHIYDRREMLVRLCEARDTTMGTIYTTYPQSKVESMIEVIKVSHELAMQTIGVPQLYDIILIELPLLKADLKSKKDEKTILFKSLNEQYMS